MVNITSDSWDQNKKLEPICYPITQLEAAQVLQQAWITLFGSKPSLDSLAILFAQFGLETGYGKYAHCANFGNVKSGPTDGYLWTSFKCNEIINGKEVWYDWPSPYCRFRAYKNNQEGALYYLSFVSQKTRYKKAWDAVIAGNPTAYCSELKTAGYFTADLTLYTKGVVSICNQFKNKYSSVDLSTHVNPPNDTPIEPIFTQDEIAQIQGNVSESISNSLNDYFTSSRLDSDERDVDYGLNDVNNPIPMPQSVWSSLTNIFKGNK